MREVKATQNYSAVPTTQTFLCVSVSLALSLWCFSYLFDIKSSTQFVQRATREYTSCPDTYSTIVKPPYFVWHGGGWQVVHMSHHMSHLYLDVFRRTWVGVGSIRINLRHAMLNLVTYITYNDIKNTAFWIINSQLIVVRFALLKAQFTKITKNSDRVRIQNNVYLTSIT